MKTRSSNRRPNSISKKDSQLDGRKPQGILKAGSSCIEALEARIAPANVVVFDNGSYVDTADSNGSESDNIQFSLAALGHTVTTFTGITAADFHTALTGAEILVIPELEVGSLAPALSADALTEIRNFVSGGGGFLIAAASGANDETLLNTLFGYSLTGGSSSGAPSLQASAAAGTDFASGPASLLESNGHYPLSTASLPGGAKAIYTAGTSTSVAIMPYGSGEVVFLAYDWYNSAPRNAGGQDGGWHSTLSASVQQLGVPAETSITLDGSGNLIIQDTLSTTNDTLTIRADVANGRYVIQDAANKISSAVAGSSKPNSNTVYVPFSAVTGSLIIFDTLDGDDQLTVDLSGGSFPKQIAFQGGNQVTSSGDRLVISGGGNQGAVAYNYTNAHDGSIVMQNYGTVTYTGLEPITNTGTASDITFNLPAGTNNATLGDDGISGNGLSRLSGATFELTDFANPTGSITINRGGGADTLTVQPLPDFNASLTIGSGAAPFGSINFTGNLTLAAHKNLTAHASGPISLSNSNADLAVTGLGSISLNSGHDISIVNGASLSSIDGAITLAANTAGTAAGNFTGIQLHGTISTATGSVLLAGTGGNTGSSNFGIQIGGAGSPAGISSTSGTVTLVGVGGAGSGGDNDGIMMHGGSAASISSGGNISLTGTSGAYNTPTRFNEALNFEGGSSITSLGGNITLITDDEFRLDAAISAGTNTVTLKQKTAGESLNITNDFYAGISASQLAAITAGTIQIGDSNSGAITIGAAISTSNNLSLTTNAGVTGAGAITVSAGKNLNITSNGAINLNGAVSVSGTTTLAAGAANNITVTNPANALATVTVNSGATVSIRDDGGFNLGAINTSTGLVVESAGTITQTGALTGAGSLTKQGTGTLTLSQSNSYSGGTTISAGTIQFSHPNALGSGTVTLNDASTGTNNTALLATAVMNNDGLSASQGKFINNIVVANSGTGTSTIGTTTFSGAVPNGFNGTEFAGTLTLNKATTLQSGNTDRTNFTNTISGNVGLLTIAGGARVSVGSPGVTNTFTGNIQVTGTNTVFQIDYAANAIPDTTNVDLGAGTALVLAKASGDNESINALTGSGTVRIANIPNPQTLTVGAGGGSGTFSGTIQNGGATLTLVKAGAGTQTLSGTNSYSGGTTINGGTLSVSANANLGTGNIAINNGTLAITGSSAFSSAKNIAFGAGMTGNIDVSNTAGATFSGALSGGGGGGVVQKMGTGTLTLTGNSTLGSGAHFYLRSGTVVIDGGSLTANDTWQNIGYVAGDVATLTIQNGGSFNTNGDLNLGDHGGTGTVNIIGATSSVTAGNLYIGKGISAPGTGTVNQSGGTLTVAGINLATNPGSTGTYNLNGGTLTTAGIAKGTGSSATFNFNGGTLRAGASNPNFLTGLTTANVKAGGALIDTNGYDITIAQTLLHDAGLGATADGGLTKLGAGSLNLTAANTYTGGTALNAGRLSFSHSQGLGSGAVNVAAGAQLMFGGTNMVVTNNITLNGLTTLGGVSGALIGGVPSGPVNNTLSGTLTLAATSNLSTVWDDKVLNITGQVTGPGGLQVDYMGAGFGVPVIQLSNPANDYAGNTIVNAGTLVIGASNVIPDGAGKGNVVVNGALVFNGDFNETVNGLSGSGSIAKNVGAGSSTLSVGNNNQSSSFTGVISNNTGSMALTKVGSGTFTLTGANTFTGGVTVNGGTLQAGNNAATTFGTTLGSTTVARTITINSGATLELLGRDMTSANESFVINGGTLRASGYSHIGDVTLSGGSIITGNGHQWDYNALSLGGNVTVTGTAASSISTVGTTNNGIHLGSNTVFNVNDVAAGADLLVSASLLDRSGTVSWGAGGLTKQGAGTMILSGANGFTGAGTVAAGTLLVDGSIATSANAVNVNGGTLGGTGTISRRVNVNTGGVITAGTDGGVGTLAVTDLVFDGGTYRADLIGSAADRINVSGVVTLAQPVHGVFSLNNQASGVAEATVFRLIDKVGTIAIVNTPFTNAAEGTTLTVDGKTARYSYQGGTGNDFTLTVDGNVVTAGTSGADNYELRRVISGGVDLTQLLLGGNVVDSRPTAGVTSWTINAGDGNDSLFINYGSTGGFLNIPITFNGENAAGAPGDTITISGPAVGSVTHDFTGTGSGSFTVVGGSNTRTITYTGTEGITDGLIASDRTFNFSGATETITFTDAAGANSNVTSTAGNNVTFANLANATSTLNVTGGDGNDTINVTSLDAAFAGNLSIAGNTGTDTISLGSGLPLFNSLTTASETLAPLPALNIGAGGLSILAFSAVTQTGALSVAGPTSISANTNPIVLNNAGNDFVGAVSLTNSGAANSISVTDVNSLLLGTISTAGTFTANAGGTLTQTGVAPALVAANAVVTAATGINLRTTVTSLNATNTTSGDIIIRETNGLNLTGARTLGGNGNIDISNLNGASISDSITVTGLVSANGSGDITLRSRYGLTLGDVVSGDDVVTGSGDIALLADHTVNIQDAHVTTSGDVTIDADFNNLANTGPITTGSAGLVTGNNLTLKAAGGIAANTSVNTVAAANIFSGDVIINEQNGLAVDLISNPGRAVIIDVAAGEMTDNNAGNNFASASVSLRAATGIGISGANGALESSNGASVLDLKAITATGGIAINNSGPLRISDTGAFNPANAGYGARVTGASGGITINAGSPITIAANESAPGAISHTAGEVNDSGTWADDLTVNSGVSITSTGSSVTLQAGDDIVLNGGVGLQISAQTTVTLRAAFNDLDSKGEIVQNGAIQGGGLVTLTARDLVTLGANVTSTAGNVTIQSLQNDIFQSAAGALVSGDVVTLTAGGANGDISGSSSGYLGTSANTIAFNAPGSGNAFIRETNGAEFLGFAGNHADLRADAGDVVIGGITADSIVITAVGGAIIDGNTSGPDLIASTGVLSASTGIGAAGAIETAFDRLEAQSSTGGIRISDINALTIGGISAMNGVTTGTGDIVINSGALTIEELISTANDVTLNSSSTIVETGSGAIHASTLLASSDGGQTLNGPNTIARFDSTNTTSGNISLINTSATLTLARIANLVGSATVVNTGNVQLGDNVLSANVHVANVASITALGGSITDGNDTTPGVNNITAIAAILSGGTGVGTSANPIETTVANIEIEGGTGGVYIAETDALTIGGATPGLSGIRADGDIRIQSGALTIQENIDTVSNVILNANGSITETSGAVKNAALLTTTSVGGQQLGGANTVRAFTATNTGAGTNILLDNNSLAGTNSGGLVVNNVTNQTGGTVTINNIGDVTVVGAVTSGANPLPLGGDISIVSSAVLTVAASGSVNSRGGSGGTLTLVNQVNIVPGASVIVGSGDVRLEGGAGDMNIDAPISVETPLTLLATGNINIRAKVETTLTTSDLNVVADTDFDTQGGIRVFPQGELKAGHDLTLTGSDYIGTPEIDSIIIDADATGLQQLGAFGNIRLLNSGAAPLGAATYLSGYVNAITDGDVTFEHAVVLSGDGARVTTHGDGNILFNGTVGGNSDLRLSTDVGLITFDEAVGSVASPIGDLQIDSALDVTAVAGFHAQSVNVVTASGTVSFQGPVTTGSTGGDFVVNAVNLALESTVNGGLGDIVWSVNNLSIGGNLSGTGSLTIQPLILNRSIGLNAAGDLNLSATEIAYLQNGFASIQIGSASGSGAITVGEVTFHDAVTILSPASGGSIAVNGAISGDDSDADVTLRAPSITLNVEADSPGGVAIGTQGGDVALTGNVVLAANTRIETAGGSFTQDGTINGAHALMIATGTGDINFNGSSTGASIGGSAALDSIDLSGGTINLRPQIITSGSQTYTGTQINLLGGALRSTGAGSIFFEGPVQLAQLISISTAGSLGDNIVFNGSLDSASSGVGALKANAGTGGAVYFSGDVGSSNALASMTVASARLVQVSQEVFVQGALEFTSDEITFLGGASSIHGNSTLVLQPVSRDVVTVVGGANEISGQLDLTATDIAALADGFTKITIGRDLGEAGLRIEPATAAGVSFSDPVVFEQSGRAGVITVLGGVHGTGDASLDFRTTRVVLDGGTGLSITTQGQPVSFDATVLASHVSINTGAGTGAITFRSTIQDFEGGNDLSLAAGSGDISLLKTVGTTKGMTLGAISLTTAGVTRINGAVSAESFALNAGQPMMGTAEILAKSFTTTGAAGQVFNADLQLNSTTRFNSNNGPVTFGGEIDSRPGKAYSALVSAGTGNVLFLGDIGSDVALGTLRAKTKGDVTFQGSATARGVQVVATTFTLQDVHGILSQSYVGAGTFDGALTGGKLKISSTSSITSAADWNLTGRVTLKASKNSISLLGANQFAELDVFAADAVIHEAGDMHIRSASVTSTLSLVADGNITDGTRLRLGKLVATSLTGSITLDGINRIASLGAVSAQSGVLILSGGTTLSLTGVITTQTGNVIIVGNDRSSSNVVVSGGSIQLGAGAGFFRVYTHDESISNLGLLGAEYTEALGNRYPYEPLGADATKDAVISYQA